MPNWLIATPDPSVAVGYLCEPFKVEMVIRGYVSGHAAREYAAGKRKLCGVTMPEGLKENEIVGHRIPAGTGMREYDATIVGSKDDYNDMMANKEEYIY